MKIRAVGFVLMVSLFLNGCSTTKYRMTVDSISSPDYEGGGQSYVVLPQPGTPAGLQFDEYQIQLESVLNSLGYRRTADASDAQLLIYLSYGISDPQTISQTTSTPEVKLHKLGTPDKDKKTTYRTTSYTTTTYIRHAVVAAYENQAELTELWQTTIKSIGSSGDLRRVFPFLMLAGRDYFGINTGQQVVVTLAESALVEDE